MHLFNLLERERERGGGGEREKKRAREGETQRQRERVRETDRQTDRQTRQIRQTDKTDRQTDRDRDRERARHRETEKREREREREINRQTRQTMCFDVIFWIVSAHTSARKVFDRTAKLKHGKHQVGCFVSYMIATFCCPRLERSA